MQHMRAFFILLAVLQLSAQPNQDRLTVTGDAEIKVAPDRVVINVGVESRNPQLSIAKSHNDTAIAAILAAAKREQVTAADVQTDFIEITPVYQSRTSTENREAYTVDFYRVNKTVAITLRDVTRFERLLTTVIDAGANRVYGVNFQTSELRKHRDQAREMAVKAAIEKAQAMAAAAGLRVDKPESIAAYNQAGPVYGRSMSNAAQNASFAAGNDLESGGTIAPGRITVSAAVTLTFRLLP
jgi:uncharacterized protein YggE